MFGERDVPDPPPGQWEFERAMAEAVSTGGDAWIVTKSGELFVGEVEKVSVSVENADLYGREVTVTINGRELLYHEVNHWTAGLTGEPQDVQLDASITQLLDLAGPMSAEDLVVRLASPPGSMWCTVLRAEGRLKVLEGERWVRRTPDGKWTIARRRTSRGWEPR